jgi:hypothetical protein
MEGRLAVTHFRLAGLPSLYRTQPHTAYDCLNSSVPLPTVCSMEGSQASGLEFRPVPLGWNLDFVKKGKSPTPPDISWKTDGKNQPQTFANIRCWGMIWGNHAVPTQNKHEVYRYCTSVYSEVYTIQYTALDSETVCTSNRNTRCIKLYRRHFNPSMEKGQDHSETASRSAVGRKAFA